MVPADYLGRFDLTTFTACRRTHLAPPGGNDVGMGRSRIRHHVGMTSAPPPARAPLVLALAEPGGVKRLLGRRDGIHRLSLTPQELTVEHGGTLRAPLRFAPGSVVAAAVDAGPADVSKRKPRGRFPVLHRLTADRVVPREAGIDGWLWTSSDGSAFTVLGDEAPNLAFLFSPPLTGGRIAAAFEPEELAELVKRSPLGEPAVFGLLMRVTDAAAAEHALGRYGMLRDVTDREIPPTQRRHLADDKPANPSLGAVEDERAPKSVPPPGRA